MVSSRVSKWYAGRSRRVRAISIREESCHRSVRSSLCLEEHPEQFGGVGFERGGIVAEFENA